MTARTCPRPGCGRPLDPAAFVCGRCARHLSRDLRELADLAREVLTTLARLDRHGGGGSRRTEIGLPVNLGASDRLGRVTTTVCCTARWVAGQRNQTVPGMSRDPLPLAARWLAGQVDWLRHRADAPARFCQLARACGTIRHVVDSPPSRVYLGPCGGSGCEADLYAHPHASWASCPDCRAQHPVDQRRAWLRKTARDYAFTIVDIADAYRLNPSTLRTWAARGQIVPVGTDRRGRRLFPLGEVLDRAAQAQARRATAHARRQHTAVSA